MFRDFFQKYPQIKVEADRVRGSNSREKMLDEAIAGLVESDVADISSDLQDNFVKAGVLAGPIQWRKLFPGINELQISPNGYFVGVGFSAHIIEYNPLPGSQGPSPKEMGEEGVRH